MKGKYLELIAVYIITILSCIFVFTFCFNNLMQATASLQAVIIPVLVLLMILIFTFFYKLVLQILMIILSSIDMDENSKKVENHINKVNTCLTYSLLIIFAVILSITMILDIILCIQKNKLLLLFLSIIIWLCLIYSIIKILLRK